VAVAHDFINVLSRAPLTVRSLPTLLHTAQGFDRQDVAISFMPPQKMKNNRSLVPQGLKTWIHCRTVPPKTTGFWRFSQKWFKTGVRNLLQSIFHTFLHREVFW
jgi:hypothetical protein